jgi:hypothetical protein
MNGRKAKRLRKQAYGDQPLRGERSYFYVPRRGRSGCRPIVNGPGSPRAVYQQLKKSA